MAQDTFARLAGTRVAITEHAGPFRRCPHCGGDSATLYLHDDALPHLASLRCAGCGHKTAWLGRDHLAAMLAQHKGAA